MVTIRLTVPRSDEDWRAARRLVEEYAASLQVDLCFQNFAHELEHLAAEYGPPGGAFLLADDDGELVGCVGLRRFAGHTGEIKRLYVRAATRGHRVGRLLAEAIVAEARRLGYADLVLDTLPDMKAAQSLYASLGFRPAAPYRHNPVPGAVFLELALRATPEDRPQKSQR